MRKLSIASLILLSGLVHGQPLKTQSDAAKSFMRIFQKADTAALLGLLPPPAVFRLTAPEETQGKSDEEINKMIQPLRDELVMGFQYLLREADSLAIDRTKIKLAGQRTSPITTYPGFHALLLEFSYGKKKGEFSLGAAIIDGVWYIYAIDQMLGVFTGMVPVKK